jgi:citrate synthase
VGYCAHWRESLTDPDTKIIRPQQDYRGVWLRHFVPMAERGTGSSSSSSGGGLGGLGGSGGGGAAAGGGGGGDQPQVQPPGNAYRRRVAGEGWM